MNEMTITNLNRLATEIKSIKQHVGRIMLDACIEVGRRLKEAKELVPYGEWGTWVEHNVDYSQRRANDMIKLYNEYGSKQLNMLETEDSQSIAKLDYTKALTLLGLPAEEREEFVENNNIDDMTTKDLKEAIKAKNAAERKFSAEHSLRKETALNLSRAENNVLKLEEEIKELKQTGNEDKQEELDKAKAALDTKKEEIKKLKQQLEEKPKEVEVEVVPPEMEKELADLRAKVSSEGSPLMIKFKFQIGELRQDLGKLNDLLSEVMDASDTEGVKCMKAFKTLLDITLEGLG